VSAAAEDTRRAVAAITAMTEGDPSGFVVPFREAVAEDEAEGGNMRRIGLVSALSLLGAAALSEMDRMTGQEGTGLDWLRRQALDFQGE
jgi:hypothetical protein